PVGSAVLRSGARAGDLVCVTGTLGDAALGLRLWQAGATADDAAQWLCRRLRQPQWRHGVAMRGLAQAALAMTDGLVAALAYIRAASHCGARIDVDAVPASAAFTALCPAVDRRGLQLAGGDDYELCIVIPEKARATLAAALGCPLT